MAKISQLPLANEPSGSETIPMVQDGQTRRGAIGALVSSLAVPHVVSAEMARDQAADLVLPQNIFVATTVAAAVAAGEAAVAQGTNFKAAGTSEGYVEVRSRTATGSDLLYTEITQAALSSTVGDNFVGSDDRAGGSLWSNVAGFLRYLRSSVGAGIVGFVSSGLGAYHRTVLEKLRERKSVKDFGAIGDNTLHPVSEWVGTGKRYASLAALQVDYPHVTATTQSIDWAAFIAAANYAKKVGALIEVPCGDYWFNETNHLANPDSGKAKSFGFKGENGNSTRLYFDNATPGKDFFKIGSDISYMMFRDLEFIDVTPGTSRCFYFSDTRASAVPTWKHLLQNVRVSSFWEGARFDGGATINDDAYLSETMFLHSKFRNCRTSLIYNNIQAVNHQLIGLDIENDQEGPGEEWPMIVLERGTVINHLGGSVIGHGSYLKYKYANGNDFQVTSQFVSKGVRMEKKASSSPVIDHDPTSTIVPSNSMHIVIDDMEIQCDPAEKQIFARLGGRTYLQLDHVQASREMTIDAYMTANLRDSTQYGFIQGDNLKNISYNRIWDKAAYGSSAGVAGNDFRSIPAELSSRVEDVQWTVTDGYVQPRSDRQTIYSGGAQITQPKTFAYGSVNTGGIGFNASPGSVLFQLPLYARPYKFRVIREDINATSPFVLDLYAVVNGIDYLVATITPTAGEGGHWEANLRRASGLAYFFVDNELWDGRMKFVKSGTINGFVGSFYVDYM